MRFNNYSDSIALDHLPRSNEPLGVRSERETKDLLLHSEAIQRMTSVYTPYFDVKETIENYVFMADLPGLKEGDVDVEICDGCLTIAGEREQDVFGEGESYYALDRHFGAFCLTFTLPNGVESQRVNAQMANGVLTVKVPKLPRGPVCRVAITREH